MSDVHDQPIHNRIAWLTELAERHGEAFRSPEAMLARTRYQSRYPTAIAVLKCMDGRINIPVATDTIMVNTDIHLTQISEVMGIPIGELRALNPQYRTGLVPGSSKPFSLSLLTRSSWVSTSCSLIKSNIFRCLKFFMISQRPSRLVPSLLSPDYSFL